MVLMLSQLQLLTTLAGVDVDTVVTKKHCDSGVAGVCCRCSEQTVGSVFYNACVAADYPDTAVFAISWNTTKLVNITTQGNRCESSTACFGDRSSGQLLALVTGWLFGLMVIS